MQTEGMIKLGRVQFMILGGVLAVIIFFGREFFQLWVGHIKDADPTLSFHITLCLVIPQTFALVQALGWQISQARNALKQRVLITAFNSLLFIIVSYFVCKHLGIAAQAIWAAVSILIQLAMLNLIHYRSLGLNVGHFYKATFRGAVRTMIILSVICMAINAVVPSGSIGLFLLKLAVFIPFYPIIIASLYATDEERRMLPLMRHYR
jgi:hypothetical protein